MNLFVVAPDYDHNWRTASFACCINDGAKERFTAKWEQLLWLPKPRRSACSQDNRARHRSGQIDTRAPGLEPFTRTKVAGGYEPSRRFDWHRLFRHSAKMS